MDAVVNLDDLARRAKRKLPRIIWDFLEGGAEDEVTLQRNRRVFDDVVLEPRVLVDVSRRSLATTLLGQQLAFPVLVAPTGLMRLAHPEGERAAARAARDAGTMLVASSAASMSLEEIAEVSRPGGWFQLYPWRDRSVSESLMERAHRSGYRTLCVTVDVPHLGGRERDLRNGFTLPFKPRAGNIVDVARHPAWLWNFAGGLRRNGNITLANFAGHDGPRGVVSLARYMNEELVNPANDWSELRWMRDHWPGTLVLKGVMRVDDAQRAVDTGVDALVVSNHGGRQLDGTSSTLAALARIRMHIGDSVPLVFDGGIRRGTDVIKAIALGARACLIGRACWYGLACGGEQGVSRVFRLLAAEIDRALALLGCPDVESLGPGVVRWSAASPGTGGSP